MLLHQLMQSGNQASESDSNPQMPDCRAVLIRPPGPPAASPAWLSMITDHFIGHFVPRLWIASFPTCDCACGRMLAFVQHANLGRPAACVPRLTTHNGSTVY